MGTSATVLVTGGTDDLLRFAQARLAELEARWSRFIATSDVSRLNAASGAPTIVSSDTVVLLERARHAWRETGGAFDPTVYGAVEALGYDRTFAALGTAPRRRRPGPPTAAPGLEGLEIEGLEIRLPPGVRFDPGAIGKGLAADLVAGELLRRGAEGVVVDVGGDVRIAGSDTEAWGVEVEDHIGEVAATLAVATGGVATSTAARRRWWQDTPTGPTPRHHLVDPVTGEPATGPLRSVTIVAGEAWLAETLATATYLRGPGSWLGAHGATGLITVGDHVIALPGIEEYLR